MRDIYIRLKPVIEKLSAKGYTGLYCPGECACEICEIAPCGKVDEIGEYINGCLPGYKHVDPRSEFGDFIVTDSTETPDEDTFDRYLG